MRLKLYAIAMWPILFTLDLLFNLGDWEEFAKERKISNESFNRMWTDNGLKK